MKIIVPNFPTESLSKPGAVEADKRLGKAGPVEVDKKLQETIKQKTEEVEQLNASVRDLQEKVNLF